MTLDEALYYIHSVCWKGSVPGLERISALLDKMGHPERKLKFIHVTGTNGKGSTCAMLASMFTKAGYKTGLYTSPYLIRFNERIQIGGVQISDADICEITEYIKPLADSIFEQPTEFEMVTALGFEYFARQGCDLVVCEVGMGGEFDATNVILPPETAIICNIGLDHTEVLGDTLEKIAATKSGIIKPGCDAVIYRESPSVEAVIEARCKEVGAKLHKADFADIHLISHDLTGQVFDWERFKRLKLPLLGDHQLHNAAVALTTATVMQQRGWKLTDDDIREGLASVRWPGRFDVRRSDPLFIIDGGHNPQCIQALVKNIQDYLPGRPDHVEGAVAEHNAVFACVLDGQADAVGDLVAGRDGLAELGQVLCQLVRVQRAGIARRDGDELLRVGRDVPVHAVIVLVGQNAGEDGQRAIRQIILNVLDERLNALRVVSAVDDEQRVLAPHVEPARPADIRKTLADLLVRDVPAALLHDGRCGERDTARFT